MRNLDVALVEGDGSAPEMMAVATEVVKKAAEKDGLNVNFIPTPMGWAAYKEKGDTLPAESLKTATDIGLLYFGGVGDPKFDDTIGVEHPNQRPEAKTLLTLRKEWGLLLNFRPMIFWKGLEDIFNVKKENLPEYALEWHFVRFLLEDSYFGTRDLADLVLTPTVLGVKQKGQVTGDEDMVTDLAYYNKKTLETYFREVNRYAQRVGLPVTSIDKSNIMPRYDFWRIINKKIDAEFPNVEHKKPVYVDAANAMLFQDPAALHGVIACGNEHGDILSDGGAGALGSMGLMCSSAVNPNTNAAMFESGAGTAPTLAGRDIVNPLGRILTGGMLLEHVGAVEAAAKIKAAVKNVLESGLRTGDLISKGENIRPIGTKAMGNAVIDQL